MVFEAFSQSKNFCHQELALEKETAEENHNPQNT